MRASSLLTDEDIMNYPLVNTVIEVFGMPTRWSIVRSK